MMKSLLIVDDDDALRGEIAFALAKHYTLFEAHSYESALGVLELRGVDIALVDLGLPPYENTHKIGKKLVEYILLYSHAKVIVLTGQESSEYAKELINLGVFDYLYKPIEFPNLLDALKRASFFIEHESRNSESIRVTFNVDVEEGLKKSSEEAQRQLLLGVLKETGFNINQSAKMLGISRENCYYFLKKFNITRSDV